MEYLLFSRLMLITESYVISNLRSLKIPIFVLRKLLRGRDSRHPLDRHQYSRFLPYSEVTLYELLAPVMYFAIM
jgi:hypothetical protein